MKGIKLQPREKLIVAVAVLSVLGYGFYSFWFQPYNAKLDELNNKIAAQQAETNQYKQLMAKSKDYTTRKAETEAKAEALRQQLPTVEAAPSVLEDLKALFERNGASVKGINFDKAATQKAIDPSLDSKGVNITFTATYPQTLAIMGELETGTRTCTIANLNLNRDKGGSLNGTMSLDVYFAKTALPGFEYKPILVTQSKSDPFAQ